MDNSRTLLLVGVSTRALAASVCRSGYRGPLLTLDFFADTDHPLRCRRLALGRDVPGPLTTGVLLRAAIALEPGAVMFSGGMENHPRLLARLQERSRVIGNSAGSVDALGNLDTFLRFLGCHELPYPRTWVLPEPGRPTPVAAVRLARQGRLLWKPRHGGGGVRIRDVGPERGWIGALPRRGYLQEKIRGVSGSVSFVADSHRYRVLGYSQALHDPVVLKIPGHAYGGSLLGPPEEWLSTRARRTLERAAGAATQAFDLRGLNGIDFVLDRGVPRILEINPRFTASMELIEEASGQSLFALHRAACERGRLPGEDVTGLGCKGFSRGSHRQRWRGKGIVYALERTIAGPPAPLQKVGARDVPGSGTLLRQSWPVCTVYATGATAAKCREALKQCGCAVRQLSGFQSRIRSAS